MRTVITNHDNLEQILQENHLINRIVLAKYINNTISKVPYSLHKFTSLVEIDFNLTNIYELPRNFTNFQQLTRINISECRFLTFPRVLMFIKSLKSINISSNMITTIPRGLHKLTNLTDLDISRNRIESLPDSIGQITSLVFLFARYNRLIHISRDIGKLTQLQILTFEGNDKIAELPQEINLLTELVVLNYQGTLVEDLFYKNFDPTTTVKVPHFYEFNIKKQSLEYHFNHTYMCSEMTEYFKTHENLSWSYKKHILAHQRTRRVVKTIHILALIDPQTSAPKFAETLFWMLPREILHEICGWLPFYG